MQTWRKHAQNHQSKYNAAIMHLKYEQYLTQSWTKSHAIVMYFFIKKQCIHKVIIVSVKKQQRLNYILNKQRLELCSPSSKMGVDSDTIKQSDCSWTQRGRIYNRQKSLCGCNK